MKCFHAHTPSHSPTPSHMPMPSVTIFTGNTNDTHIPSLCRLTNTQCNFSMGNQSRVNHDSYHSTLGLSDKHDRVFSFGQQKFWLKPQFSYTPNRMFQITPWVSYTHTEFFGRYRGSLTPKFHAFHMRELTVPFLLHQTHTNYFSFYDLNYESLLDVVPKTNSIHIHQEW